MLDRSATRTPSSTAARAVWRGRGGAIALTLAVALLAVSTLTARAAEPPSVVFVFDGSGSMWSKLNGSTVTRLAGGRDAVKAGLADIKGGARVGLIAFGHRQQGSCNDIQTMVPLDGGDNARVGAALDKLSPRGKGPFVQSVREAATLLKGIKGDRHIVLLHDDPDNCQQDACAAARDISAADPGVRIHVVSIGMRTDDPGRPVCMARTTGGKAVLADTAADLTRGISEILGSVTSTAPPAVAPMPVAAKKPANPVAIAAAAPVAALKRAVPSTGPSRLLLGARLTSGAPLVDATLRWRIKAPDARPMPAGDIIGAVPDVPLPPGRYSVTVDTGAMTVTEYVDVKPEGATEHVFDLNAALVRVSGLVKRGGQPSPSAALTLRRAGSDGQVMWIGFASTAGVIVPAGELIALATDGAAKAEQAFRAEAGKTVDIALPLESGRLKLAAVARDGGPPLGDVVYHVLEDDPEASRGIKEVARSSAAAPDMVLPAGSYIVAASHGSAEVRERVIIKPGEEVARVLVVGVARLRFNVRVTGPADAGTLPVSYTLRRLDSPAGTTAAAIVTGSTDRQPVVSVNPGRYRVEIRVGDQNARMERDMDIRPGTDIVLAQTLPAARVEFALAEGAGSLAGGDMMWDLGRADGTRVWRSMQARPRLLLAPGSYTMTVDGRTGRKSKRFDVTAGDIKVEVGVE